MNIGEKDYSGAIQQLLELDMPEEIKFKWPDYSVMGLTERDIPELIRMATDEDLIYAGESEESWIWAPIHAWRALGQLKAEPAVAPLISLFENQELEDWIGQEIPQVMALIGPSAIPLLKEYAENPEHGEYPRIFALECLLKIAQTYPGTVEDIKNFIMGILQSFQTQSEKLNAFLIWFLNDLKAVEAVPLMEQAFAASKVDETIVGDIEAIQVDLGLLEARITPEKNYFWERLNRLSLERKKEERRKQEKTARQKTKKKKSKRKMATASRKRTKKKKG